MKIVMSSVAIVVLTSSMMAAVSLPKECNQFVQSDHIEQVQNDVIQETNGIASICSLLNKELNILANMEDSNASKALYISKAIHGLQDLKKFDIATQDQMRTIVRKLSKMNHILRSDNLIADDDKQTVQIILEKIDSDTYNVLKHIYVDGDIKLEKKLYLKENLIDSYYELSKKYGLVEEQVEEQDGESKIIVTDMDKPENPYRYIVSRKVNVRASPSIRYLPITQLEYQEEVVPVLYNNRVVTERGFVKIYFDNAYAWVSLSNIVKTKD